MIGIMDNIYKPIRKGLPRDVFEHIRVAVTRKKIFERFLKDLSLFDKGFRSLFGVIFGQTQQLRAMYTSKIILSPSLMVCYYAALFAHKYLQNNHQNKLLFYLQCY